MSGFSIVAAAFVRAGCRRHPTMVGDGASRPFLGLKETKEGELPTVAFVVRMAVRKPNDMHLSAGAARLTP
jgi:hypothetical protein